MSVSEQIQKDLVAAMKARQSLEVSVLRLMKSALKNKEIELGKELSPEEELAVVGTLVKQRTESIESYEKAGRTDLAEKEGRERELMRAYLPEEVSPEEIASVVTDVIAELGAASQKDIGPVMKESLARLKATGKTVDGKTVNAAVRAKLS